MQHESLTIVPMELSARERHGYLLAATSPRPIAFASTIALDGTPNLAPFSFFNVFSSSPPVLIFSPARRVRGNTNKHTLENVLRVPEVVINVVSHSIVEQMNLASCDYPDGVNEFVKAGFTEVPSELVRPPRVGESPVQMECKVTEIKPIASQGGGGNLIFCRVEKMHIWKSILDEGGRIDPHKIDLVGRMGGAWYSSTSGDAAFQVGKPGRVPGIGIDQLPEFIRNSHVLTGNDLGKLGMLTALPGPDEVAAWRAETNEEYLKMDSETLHRKAADLLAGERVEEALLLLLGYV